MALWKNFFRKKKKNSGKENGDCVLLVGDKREILFPQQAVQKIILKAKNQEFCKSEMSSEGLVELVDTLRKGLQADLTYAQFKSVLENVSFREDAENSQFFFLFENWDLNFSEANNLSIQDKFLIIRKILAPLAHQYTLAKKAGADCAYFLNSASMNSLCLFLDDVLSSYGYNNAYHDKEFRGPFSIFCPMLYSAKASSDKTLVNQAVHYFGLKVKNFSPEYNFMSNAGIGKDDAFQKHVGVTYALQSDLYKFSNLVFFSINDLEQMYLTASNHFTNSALIVTTKVEDPKMLMGEQLQMVDERKSFIFEYDKIRGHLNFPDIFKDIMKRSFVEALNSVISKQVEYKLEVADMAVRNKLEQSNALPLDASLKGKSDLEKEYWKLNKFLEFACAEFELNYDEESNSAEFQEFLKLVRSSSFTLDCAWVKKLHTKFKKFGGEDFSGLILNRKISNVVKYLVFVNLSEQSLINAVSAPFVVRLGVYESYLNIFPVLSFELRKSRERVLKAIMWGNDLWKHRLEDYLFSFLSTDIISNKVFYEDDYLCSYLMDTLFYKWEYANSRSESEEAFQLALKLKQLYALVVCNCSTEYENDFVAKYAYKIDNLYHFYVYDGDSLGTKIVLVENFDLCKFWNHKDNKSFSIKQLWASLKRVSQCEQSFKQLFNEDSIFVKFDNDIGRGFAYNDVFSIIMNFNKDYEVDFNRFFPLWFKHCITSDDISLEKMKEIMELGRKPIVNL